MRSCLCLCVFAFYDKATTHTLFAHIRPASRPCPRRAPAGRPCNKAVLPVLGTQLVLLALPLQQQLVLVRAPRQVRVLDAPHVCAACPALALAQGGAPRAFSSCRQPYSMPPIVPHVPVIPHGRQWSQHGEEGARRPWGAPGWRAQTAPCS